MSEPAGNQQPVMGNENLQDSKEKPNETKTATVEALQSELDLVRGALQKANKEAESRRKKLDDFEAKEKQAEEAKLSEMEKLQKQVNDANAAKEAAIKSANAKLIKAEILQKASKFIDADAAFALIDTSKITVKDDGSVDGVDAALADLEKSKPHLLKSNNGKQLNPTNPGNAATNETPQQQKDRIFGGKQNPFDRDFSSRIGGGVVKPGE